MSVLNFDTRRYQTAPLPFNVSRGPVWTTFRNNIEQTVLMGIRDKFASGYDHVVTRVDPGNINGPAHAGGNIGAESINAARTRAQACYSAIILHLELNTNYKDAAQTRFAAFQAAANAAVPVPFPADWVHQIWNALDAMGTLPQTQLTTAVQGNAWTSLSLAHVGINRETPMNFYSFLGRVNREYVVPNNNAQMHIKFCQAFSFPQLIRDKCLEDLQAPKFVHAGGALAGQPDLPAFVDYILELWHSLYDSPERPIKDQPPTAIAPSSSNRVDGMSANIEYNGTAFAVSPDGMSLRPQPSFLQNVRTHMSNVGSGMSAAVVWALAAMTSAGGNFVNEERDCWNCKGWGHTKEDCPSAKRPRPLSACVRALQEKMNRERGRLSNARTGGRRFIRRRGVPPGDRRRAPPGDTPNAFYVYDDGSIYNSDGTLHGLSADFTPDELCGSCDDDAANQANAELQNPDSRDGVLDCNVVNLGPASTQSQSQAPAASPPPPPVTARDETVPGHGQAAAQQPAFYLDTGASSNADAMAKMQRSMDNEFGEIYVGGTVFQTADGHVGEIATDPFENTTPNLATGARPQRRWPKLAAAAGMATLALVCVLAKSKGAKLAVIAGTCIAQTHGFALGATGAILLDAAGTAGNHGFTTFEMLEFPIADKRIASPIDQSGYGVVDTGASRVSGYKKNLFPPKLITRVNPPYRVRIANGDYLKVEAEGSMCIKTRTRGTSSAKKLVIIMAAEALLVPQMHVTLISPKSLFRLQGIKTYFNDELYFRLPNGDLVDFIETDRNYLLLLEEGFEYDELMQHMERGNVKSLSAQLASKATLIQPIPVTRDLTHERIMHFSWEKFLRSKDYIEGVDWTKLCDNHDDPKVCIHCVRGAFRGHRKGKRDRSKFTKFGERIYSDSCAMPRSTPFGYCEMYVFFDAATEFLALYFGKTTTSDEMMEVFKQFLTDYGRFMEGGT